MKKVVMLLSMLMMIGIGLPSYGATAASKDDRPIAVQGAMDVEVSALLKEMGSYRTETYGSYTYYIGHIGNVPVVVSRTEIGMVNAAASTTLLIEKYYPKAIVNQGTAGGHDPNLHVFDTVVGSKVMNIGNYRTERLADGQGIKPETWIFQETSLREHGTESSYDTFSSDPELVKAALSAAPAYKHGKVAEGFIGSADVWNREVDRIQWFHDKIGTSAEEMEAAAVAQVAQAFHVPYLSLRTISNSEVSGDTIEDLTTAGQYGAEFAVEVVKAIDKQVQFASMPSIYVKQIKLRNQHAVWNSNGEWLVPVRSVTEFLGGQVKWDGAKRQFSIQVNDAEADVSLADGTAVADGKPHAHTVLKQDGVVWVDADLFHTALGLSVDVLGSEVYIQ
ncbi:phosphorylase family protein [Paenibacillus apiarius]|uniref:Stalk domain-containing protein n=1 Tax=Paenibacillus apiarius TaxID=46240 RepID=A0ABT4DQ35_9BACL|nr:stalk domain-containing protein [Paenibacillus apiarius]MCY9513940.1 stalk domain-containing protein [Paenibacillus apiarius]MCY9519457.1 stalk domain-containing protein [Paenibacillus apiarius]MCY9552384.1 stalk domain-containing protein [Paenibacillus apiarius]MCY9556212.1 stalk domain-containing protein [Paenibacillus apiarius]MCY9681747.1 stalk domain-containing protein [Paenibacillus apiarius]